MISREKVNDIFFLLLSRSFINKIFIFPIICLYLVGFCSDAFPSSRDERICEPPPWHNHPQLIKKLEMYDALSTTEKNGVYTAEGNIYFYADQIEVRSCLGMLVVEPIFVMKDGTFIEIAFDDKFREILSQCAYPPVEFGYHRFIPMRTHDKKRTYDIIKVVPFISDEDRYEELTPFPLANLRHHPVESCEVKVKGTFIREENPIHPKFTSIYKPKNPPKKTRVALRLIELSIKK